MNASQPALYVTFIIRRRPNNGGENNAASQLITHLARPEGEGGLGLVADADNANKWRNTQQETWLLGFTDSVLTEVELWQLALNPSGDADRGWLIAAEQLKRAMAGLPAGAQKGLLGMTLVYQAVIPPDLSSSSSSNTASDILNSLLRQKRVRSSDGQPLRHIFATGAIPGGELWLLQVADESAENIYVALGTEAEQRTLNRILFGKGAALLYPDTIAHKAYAMARSYLTEGTRKRFRQEIDNLMTQTISTLRLREAPDEGISTLDELSSHIANLTVIIAELRRLHSALEVHQFNYHRTLELTPLPLAITSYHKERIRDTLFRIEQDNKDTSAALQAAHTATNTLRAQYERRLSETAQQQLQLSQERAAQEALAVQQQTLALQQQAQIEQQRAEQKAEADKLTQGILAVLGAALTVAQLIDSDPWLMYWRFLATIFFAAAAALLVRWQGRSR